MPNDNLGSVIRFGVFEVDRRSGDLRKQGVRVKLRDQSFQVLVLLLERPGEVVTREELRGRLWSTDTFVDFESGLNKAVNRLRDVLGDSADSPTFIETLPKRGYRFIAPVQGLTTTAQLPAEPLAGTGAPAPSRTSDLRWMVTAVALLVAIAAASYVFLARRPHAPPERARVVLAEFENRTGDAAFDDTLKQALAIDLEQSPVLKILSDDEVTRTLRLMHRRADERLTTDVARDVCQRTNGQVVLGGSLAILSTEYVLGLSAVNCRTGETLAREQVRAQRKEDVLEGLDKAASSLRGKLGESLTSIQTLDGRVHNVLSTSSLEAFQAYTSGERMVLKGRSAVPFFKRAVDLDPDFAYAHAALGLVYGTIGEAGLSSESTRRAYELRERVSEWEKYFLTAQYYFRVTGEIEKIPSVCLMWNQSYPNDRTVHNRLAYAYRQLGQYDNALMEYQQARTLGGDHPVDLLLLATTYMNLDRLEEAANVVRQALAANPDDPRIRRIQYLLGFLRGDRANTESVASPNRHAGADGLLFEQSDTEAYFGRLANARELTRLAIESERQQDFKGRTALWLANDALREALVGNADAARRQAGAALDLASGWDVRVLAALALGWTGDALRARKLGEQLRVEFPVSTLIQNYWLPALAAEVELSNGNAAQAVTLLNAASAYELADTASPAGPALYPAYLRGLAYLRARQGAAGAAEFQKILHHRGLVGNHPVGALARLGLARAYALSGDIDKARTEYQDFVALWKDADLENPVLTQAKAEYGAIHR